MRSYAKLHDAFDNRIEKELIKKTRQMNDKKPEDPLKLPNC